MRPSKPISVLHRWRSGLVVLAVVAATLTLPAVPATAELALAVTSNADAGPGSYRQAVLEAGASTEPVVITFDPGLVVVLSSGVIYTGDQDLTLVGNGSVLDGDVNVRILAVTDPDPIVTAEDLTLQHGAANFGAAIESAGDVVIVDSTLNANNGADGGGAVRAAGRVTVHGSTFTDNDAGVGDGGAIRAGGQVTVGNSTFTDNQAAAGNGGAIHAGGPVTVEVSTFAGNTAGARGGAISAPDGVPLVTVDSSTFTKNLAGGAGGAVRAGSVSISGSTFVDNHAQGVVGSVHGWDGGAVWSLGANVVGSSFSLNTATASGGALFGSQITIAASTFNQNNATTGGAVLASNGWADVTTSTFSQNSATGGEGGAIRGFAASVSADRSTFNNNSATTRGGGIHSSAPTATNSSFTANFAPDGAAVSALGAGMVLHYVTVAQNTGTSQLRTVAAGPLSSTASVVAAPGGGANCDLDGDTTSTASFDTDATCAFAGAGDTSGGPDPELGPLADNGGPTRTMAPSATSPLIDAVAGSCAAVVAIDQRGVSRPQGPACDIGAVERTVPAPPVIPDPPDPPVIPDPSDPPVIGGVLRYGGADRFETAAMLSAATFASGVEVAYIATGSDFPDALTGAVAAALDAAPILLVTPDVVPPATGGELDRLQAARIVILGGTAAIGPAVEQALADHTAGPVTRIAGPDRFATAATVSQTTFGEGADVVYISTGANFPDALAGVPAASGAPGPLLLVTVDGVPPATVAELSRLAPTRITILGGEVAIPGSVEQALASHAPDVGRVAGPERFATAAAVAASAFPDPGAVDTVFVATGAAFPDALAGGAVAGALGAPVLLSTSGELPASAAAEIARLDPSRIIVLGGLAAISAQVEAQLAALLAN